MSKKEPKKKTGLGRIFQLTGDRKGLLAVAGILSAAAAAFSFLPYVAIYLLIRDILAIYPDFSSINRSAAISYGVLALAGVAADVLCYLTASICAHLAAFGTQYQLKSVFTQHLSRIPLGYHLTIGSGRFRKVFEEDIDKIETFIAHQFPDIAASFTAPFMMLIILFVFDWRFGLAAIASVVVALILQMLTFGAAGPGLMEQMQKTMADMSSASVEYIRGMPVLKTFGQTAVSFQQLHRAIRAYTKFMLNYTMKWENYTAAFQTVIQNIYLFLLPVGILIGQNTEDYAGFVLSFIFYLLFVPSIASVLSKLMYVASSSMRISGGVANLDQMMELPVLKEADDPAQPKGSDICFEQVTFSYQEAGLGNALTDVSFTAPKGRITAIAGPSGSGKSTIAHLIPRFWDVNEGRILIGGIDIREIETDTLMEQVSFVFQDSYLFGQSIIENIRMGRPDADDQMIIEAAKAARCDELIRRLPNGYQTVIGEAGVHLSGGEQQRIAIARAIVKDSPILILDEATAFADPENEQLIQEAINALVQDKTVIMIAHRLGTICDADQIIIMDKGRIAEIGSHENLLSKRGLYAKMWNNYTQAVSWRLRPEKEGQSDDIIETNAAVR